MSDMIQLGGDEATTWEKLDGALRLAREAAEAGRYRDLMRRLREAIEGATEIGVHRSDGNWAAVAERIEKVRALMTTVTDAQFRVLGLIVAGQLDTMHQSIAMMRVGRTRH